MLWLALHLVSARAAQALGLLGEPAVSRSGSVHAQFMWRTACAPHADVRVRTYARTIDNVQMYVRAARAQRALANMIMREHILRTFARAYARVRVRTCTGTCMVRTHVRTFARARAQHACMLHASNCKVDRSPRRTCLALASSIADVCTLTAVSSRPAGSSLYSMAQQGTVLGCCLVARCCAPRPCVVAAAPQRAADLGDTQP